MPLTFRKRVVCTGSNPIRIPPLQRQQKGVVLLCATVGEVVEKSDQAPDCGILLRELAPDWQWRCRAIREQLRPGFRVERARACGRDAGGNSSRISSDN